jgi:hypothetical protein
MKLAVLAVALLVAVGTWEVYKGYNKGSTGGEALAQVPVISTHYKCFNFVPAGPPVKQSVTLTETQFATIESVTVQTPHYVCVPVTKVHGTTTFLPDPSATPLVCYHISPSLSALKLPFTQTNQFRTESGEVTTPHLLCAPENVILPQ